MNRSLYLPDNTWQKLEQLAKEDHRTLNGMIRKIIDLYISLHDKAVIK